MPDPGPSDALITAIRAVGRGDDLASSLRQLLAQTATLGMASAGIFAVADGDGPLRVLAVSGLSKEGAAGLAAAVGNPDHPIARTAADPVPTFDVAPTAPGGPALRGHLPLVVHRDGRDRTVGVLALAYEDPIAEQARGILLAMADLAAIAIERYAIT
jgi:hypothetical protein